MQQIIWESCRLQHVDVQAERQVEGEQENQKERDLDSGRYEFDYG